jgi:hypothetical protein
MRAPIARLTLAALLLSVLAACKPQDGSGFIQVKTVPASVITPPSLYLDSEKIAQLKKGETILSRKLGTSKLQVEGPGGHMFPLCDIVVKKNRITTVTVSILERPPRCQCTHSAAGSQTGRACIG